MAHTIESIAATLRTLLAEGVSETQIAEALYEATDDEGRSTEEERELARSEHDSTVVEIDNHALASRGDSGLWVQGWIWIGHPDGEG